jgi:hypothetical protein
MSQITKPRYFLVFDVESVGLHGDAFAFGFVVLDAWTRREEMSGLRWCDPNAPPDPRWPDQAKDVKGTTEDRAWVKKNVPSFHPDLQVANARELREQFWAIWRLLAERDTWLFADCPWPVEARFLHACIADSSTIRRWQGPYPLIDIASMRAGSGQHPLTAEKRLPDELPEHDPLADARQSARILRELLEPTAVTRSITGWLR